MKKRIFKNDREKIGIYSITSPSGSKYIGMTCESFSGRWKGHIKKLKSQKHHCKGLQKASKKYGIENLKFEILEEWTKPETYENLLVLEKVILLREKFWWIHFKEKGVNLYNSCPTGTGSVFHSEEVKERISKSLKKKNSHINEAFVCGYCGEKFFSESSRNKRKYCSKECLKLSKMIKAFPNLQKENRAEDNRPSKEYLEYLYLEKKLSTTNIAELMGCSQPTVFNLLKQYEIQTRKTSCGSRYTKTHLLKYENSKFFRRKHESS